MRDSLLCAIGAFLLAVSPAVAQPAPPASAETLAAGVSADVFVVHMVGPWQNADARGTSRLVGVISGGSLRLFAQWLGADGRTVATAPMEVPDEARTLPLADIRVEHGGASGYDVFFDLPEDGGLYVATIGDPGEASFGPATN